MALNKVFNDIEVLLNSKNAAKSKLLEITQLLNDKVEYYNWVGFYFMNHKEQMLHLGPYTGATTDHVKIPFGKGICGQVAVSGTTYIAEDITSESNYIACAIDVKSEIVVPIYVNGVLVGQLDIDSHTQNAFSLEDEEFLNRVCQIISDSMGEGLNLDLT